MEGQPRSECEQKVTKSQSVLGGYLAGALVEGGEAARGGALVLDL